jgi:predicted HTH domain antitoxin
MASETIGARVPKEVIHHLSEFMEVEGVDKSTAIRRIIEKGLSEWRKERALKLLGEGKVTFLKAADLAGVSVYELIELVRQRRVEWVRLYPHEIEEEFELASEM